MVIYVGNMSFRTTEEQLRDLFAPFGTVTRVQIPLDRYTGRPRGFAFVEMTTGGEAAFAALDKKMFDGRVLTVNEAKPRPGAAWQ